MHVHCTDTFFLCPYLSDDLISITILLYIFSNSPDEEEETQFYDIRD